MSEVANTLGIPPTFTFQGIEYKVSQRTLEIEGLIERRLQSEALRIVQSFKQEFGPLEYRQQLDGFRQDCAAHVYSWGGSACGQFMMSEAGLKELAFLRLARLNPTVERPLVDLIWEDESAWELLCVAMVQADSDPNLKRAELARRMS